MSMTYKELRAASDEALVEAHDREAKMTMVGTAYYLDELNRRETERLDRSVRRLTKVNLALVVVGTLVVIVELFRTLTSN